MIDSNYKEGFAGACARRGLDPRLVVEKAAQAQDADTINFQPAGTPDQIPGRQQWLKQHHPALAQTNAVANVQQPKPAITNMPQTIQTAPPVETPAVNPAAKPKASVGKRILGGALGAAQPAAQAMLPKPAQPPVAVTPQPRSWPQILKGTPQQWGPAKTVSRL